MQTNYYIEIDDRISVIRFSQKPILSEVISAMDDVSVRGEFRLRLWIFQAGVDLRTDEIEKIGQYAKKKWPEPAKTAVVTPDDLSFGLARMHDVFREQEGVESRVFRTEREALNWLKEENDLRIP